MAGKYLLTTLGCKVNQYESQQVREVLESVGLRRAARGEHADLAVVNTCAVTVTASAKSRQAIRKVARGGQTHVIVVGCAASADAETLSRIKGVKAVLGHQHDILTELRRAVSACLADIELRTTQPDTAKAGTMSESPGAASRDKVWTMSPAPGRERNAKQTVPASEPTNIISYPLPQVKIKDALVEKIHHFEGHQRAFLKVQDGCDAYCTYCIIPQLRPDPVFKPLDVAIEEARQLVRSGHKEIILTGIFLGAYGRTTALRKRFDRSVNPLAGLVQALAAVEGLQRLRLSSLEPGDVDDELLEVLATHDNCVPHLHLPLQAGSANVLRRMNRQYSRDEFVSMIDRVRTVLDRPAISTDIIVGFPGETEADFEASVEIARYAGFCKIHAFPFSPRDKTSAARWQSEFVHGDIVRQRMQRLAEIEADCSLAFRKQFVGDVERVIVEQRVDNDDDVLDSIPMWSGRADRYFEVMFESDTVAAGDLIPVRIDSVTPRRTHGLSLAPSGRGVALPVLASV